MCGPAGRAHPLTNATVELGRQLRERISWLRAAPTRRLGSVHRFAAAGWTAVDLHQALDELLRLRGWSVPDTVHQPPAYLAALLRGLDEQQDRPSVTRTRALAAERERRAWVWATTLGTEECPHGYLAGDLPHPIDGHLACPYCRREQRAAAPAC